MRHPAAGSQLLPRWVSAANAVCRIGLAVEEFLPRSRSQLDSSTGDTGRLAIQSTRGVKNEMFQ
jgi:hypothetical protein